MKLESHKLQEQESLGRLTGGAPVSSEIVANLLGARIVISAVTPSDIAFTKTMLEISGFSHIETASSDDEIMELLRHGTVDERCEIDLLVVDDEMPGLDVHELRATMEQFTEWCRIPIISLCRESKWDHTQILTDLGHGIISLLYHPLMAESLPGAVMMSLAVKKQHDEMDKQRRALEDDLSTLKVMEARLQFSVQHDDLTGLSNRRHLEQVLETEIWQIADSNATSALLYIDLDNFKVLNDVEGHEAGDIMLVNAANTLRGFFSAQELLVRIGSDEFAVLISNIDPAAAVQQAEDLCEVFAGYSFEYHGHHYNLTASIGVKILAQKAVTTVGEVLAHANQACFTAKKRGRNCMHVYHPDDREMHNLRHSVEWAPRIRSALKQENFMLEFQPIYDLKAEKVSYYECLIRMRDEDGIIYYPNDFIPVAEAMGLIRQIDFWVVNKVFDLLHGSSQNISFAINLTGNTFLDEKLYQLVKKKLRELKIDPSRLILEITETSVISSIEETKKMVMRLRSLGCSFALDDFGSGCNSYNYLKQFPIDVLKIDGGFITGLHNDPVDRLLVKSMIEMAHSLGKKTVAEYVEHQATLTLLRDYGVDYVQGFLIGKPTGQFQTTALSGLKLKNETRK